MPSLPLLIVALQAAQTAFVYPEASRGDVVRDYAGNRVPDPYAWMEDVDSAQTKAWTQAENKLTFGYLSAIPGREKVASRLKTLLNHERFGIPDKEGGRYFYTRNDGLQNQDVLFVADSLNAKPRLLLDPNKLSKDGTVALSGTAFSHDGALMAYSLSAAGSDWEEWHVRNTRTGADLPDVIKWSKFSAASWTNDGKGFFYESYDKPAGNVLKAEDFNQKLYYHRLGTPQSSDALIYRRPDHKEWQFDGEVTNDGRYLVITVSNGTQHENRIFFKRLSGRNSPVVALFANGDAAYSYVQNIGSSFTFQTDLSCPRGKVVTVDLRRPNKVRTIVPESAESIISAGAVGGTIFVNYLKDAHSLVRVFDPNGTHLRDVALPGIGTSLGFGGHPWDHETFYEYESYTSPETIYRYDVRSGVSSVFRQPKVPFDGADYLTQELFATSKDGTKVPFFLTSRKDAKIGAEIPTLMYGYGGFDVPETPFFGTSRAVWLEMGGAYVDVVLRGGNEYGEAWHKAGMLHNKQHVFDDFIAVAEWLIRRHFTIPPKLACQGASNGGLLIGAMLTQRPDLWGATLPEVGVQDLLRFNKFTIGYAWMPEYGNPESATDFQFIRKISPLANVTQGTKYPATLITTGDHDDRVFPAHSFKFAAALQAAQAGDAPILIRIETNAGHGAGKPISKIIDEITDEWCFLMKNLGMTLPESFGR